MRVKCFELFFLKFEGGVEPINKKSLRNAIFNLNKKLMSKIRLKKIFFGMKIKNNSYLRAAI